jgi:rhodanese-related sulfurtransferase
LNEAKKSIREVEPPAAEQILADGHTTFLDVREPDEYEQGAIPNAVHLPRGHLEFQVEGKLPDKSKPVVVYCAGGVRSAFAAKTLGDLGYTDVQSLIGGFNKWKDDGRPWSAPRALTPAQRNRYQRHLLLPEIGETGQIKLLDSKVLLLGAGGLGSPAALYLAAAGVGTLGIIDMDVVDESTLRSPIRSMLCRICRCRFDSSTTSMSMMPSVPTPAAAR